MSRFVCLIALLCASLGQLQAAEGKKPNVIVIMADDFGYECVTANGGQSYSTPHLDKLAAGGVRFTQCHVQPLCTPTRVMLMTGLSNVRNYTGFGLLEKTQTTFGHIMKQAGYSTCIVGKWQLGRDLSLPKHFGFDEHCLWQLNRRPGRYKNPGLEINGQQKDFTNGEYGPDLVNGYALDFISRKKAEPFFLYYPLILTHAPFEPAPDHPDYATFGGRGEKGNQKFFGSMVAYMDKLIGKLVTRLDELGLRENTLIMFLGDNGTGGGVISQFNGAKIVGGKGQTTYRGTHVPAIVNWPGTVVRGKVCNDLIDASDFLPTFCDMAGVTIPVASKLDGQSFAPQLRGKRGTPREWLYSWYRPHGEAGKKAEYARDLKYKLYAAGDLFDLTKDPEERSPLGDLSGDAERAKKKLQAVINRFADARPDAITRQTGDGVENPQPARKRPRGGQRRKAPAAAE